MTSHIHKMKAKVSEFCLSFWVAKIPYFSIFRTFTLFTVYTVVHWLALTVTIDMVTLSWHHTVWRTRLQAVLAIVPWILAIVPWITFCYNITSYEKNILYHISYISKFIHKKFLQATGNAFSFFNACTVSYGGPLVSFSTFFPVFSFTQNYFFVSADFFSVFPFSQNYFFVSADFLSVFPFSQNYFFVSADFFPFFRFYRIIFSFPLIFFRLHRIFFSFPPIFFPFFCLCRIVFSFPPIFFPF